MASHARIEPPPAKPPRGNATTERPFSHAAPEHSDEETPPRGPRRRPNAMPTRDNRGSNAQRRTRARKPDRPRAGGPPRAPATPGANDSDPEIPVGARNCPGPDRFPEMLRVRETGRRQTRRRVAGGGDMVSPCLRASRTGGLESGATRTRISPGDFTTRAHTSGRVPRPRPIESGGRHLACPVLPARFPLVASSRVLARAFIRVARRSSWSASLPAGDFTVSLPSSHLILHVCPPSRRPRLALECMGYPLHIFFPA